MSDLIEIPLLILALYLLLLPSLLTVHYTEKYAAPVVVSIRNKPFEEHCN